MTPKKLLIKHESETVELSIRPAYSADLNFVTNSWIRAYRKNAQLMQMIPQAIYSSNQYKLILKLLERSQLIIACMANDKDQILGWVCFEEIADGEKAIHFAYVKSVFRKLGIGTALLQCALGANVTYYTHHTYFAQTMNRKRALAYNPFLILEAAV